MRAHTYSPKCIFCPRFFRHRVVLRSVRLLALYRPWGSGSDADDLLPLYRRLHESIRRIDSRKIIMFEPHVIRGQLGISTDLPKVSVDCDLHQSTSRSVDISLELFVGRSRW